MRILSHWIYWIYISNYHLVYTKYIEIYMSVLPLYFNKVKKIISDFSHVFSLYIMTVWVLFQWSGTILNHCGWNQVSLTQHYWQFRFDFCFCGFEWQCPVNFSILDFCPLYTRTQTLALSQFWYSEMSLNIERCLMRAGIIYSWELLR